MKRYTISNRSKYSNYPSRKRIGCYYKYYRTLSDETTVNDTTIHSIVFDEHWYYHRTNIYTIKILSRKKTIKFRNTRSKIKTGLRGLYNCGKI